MEFQEINNRFGFHKATLEGPEATSPKHHALRKHFMEFAFLLDDILPEGREKALAFTELENASMWAHKAIAQTAPLDAALYSTPTSIQEALEFEDHRARGDN